MCLDFTWNDCIHTRSSKVDQKKEKKKKRKIQLSWRIQDQKNFLKIYVSIIWSETVMVTTFIGASSWKYGSIYKISPKSNISETFLSRLSACSKRTVWPGNINGLPEAITILHIEIQLVRAHGSPQVIGLQETQLLPAHSDKGFLLHSTKENRKVQIFQKMRAKLVLLAEIK